MVDFLFLISIALIILFIALAATSYFKKHNKVKTIIFSIVTVFILIFSIFVPNGFQEIKSGEIAVVKVWGKATSTKTAGLHFRNVLTTKYEIYDSKVQQLEINTEVYTKDAQPSSIMLVLQFSINPENAVNIASEFGSMNSLNSKITSIAIEKSKVVLANKTAMELIATRNELSPAVQASVEDGIERFYINVHSVVITDMSFSDAFELAVENKMIAEQKKLEAEYAKEQAIIKANEEAETARIQAEADLAVAILNAQKALETAKGQAESQAIIAKGEARALKLKYIETARMLGLPVTMTEVKDEDGIITAFEYDINTETCTPEQFETLENYMRYINYLETWDGQLPEVVGDGSSLGGIIINP